MPATAWMPFEAHTRQVGSPSGSWPKYEGLGEETLVTSPNPFSQVLW